MALPCSSGESDLLSQHPAVARLMELLRAPPRTARRPRRRSSSGSPRCTPAGTDLHRRRDLARRGGGRDGLDQGVPHPRPPRGRLDPLGSEPVGDPALEPERLVPPLTPSFSAASRAPPARLLPGRDARRCPASAAGDLRRDERIRGRAHLRPPGTRLAAAGDRGRHVPDAALADEKRRLLGPPHRGRGLERYLYARSSARSSSRSKGLDVLVPMLDDAIELPRRTAPTRS